MSELYRALLGLCLALAASPFAVVSGQTLRVGVVQSVDEDTLAANRGKIIRFIRQAKDEDCRLVVFSENALYSSLVAVEVPAQGEMEDAVEQIRACARDAGVAVVFGAKHVDGKSIRTRAYAFGPGGERLAAYWKNTEVPRAFDVFGVRCNFSICSDRGYLEHSDLPCLVQGAQVIIDTSGGHGGDDGRPDLRWIRYQPWAMRTGAYLIVSNPVHDDTDFMGNCPWGGGSAVVAPDGSVLASRLHQKDVMIVVDIDAAQATRHVAERRRNHPLFRQFWDLGERLLKGEEIGPVPGIQPDRSAARDIKIAAAQITCSGDVAENTRTLLAAIGESAREGADIVVFPELAVTGDRAEDILAATQPALEEALRRIQDSARTSRTYVIVGMPYFVDGARRNCAFVIGDDGEIQTRYDQIVTRTGPAAAGDLFQPGMSTKAMWFKLRGVSSVVTIGGDADWVEIGDLAAARGMCLRFHITNEADESASDAVVRKQRDLLALSPAQFGAVINAAGPATPSGLDVPRRGGSLIASREGGHNTPAPAGLEHYLPYQTSVVCSAGPEQTILYATRRTSTRNSQDLDGYWRNRNRKSRAEAGWHDWIKAGTWLIDAEPQ